MSDLLNFDDDNDNLFKPQEQQNKPDRSIDDILGSNSEYNVTANTLNDILTPSVQDDIFETKAEPPKKNAAAKNVDSLFGDDIDNEPDIFSFDSGFSQTAKSSNISNPLEEDLLGDFLKPSDTNHKKPDITADDLFGDDKSKEDTNDIDDLFAISQSESKNNTDELDDLFGDDKSKKETNNIDDLFAISQSESKNNTDELDDSFAINQSESKNNTDELDDLFGDDKSKKDTNDIDDLFAISQSEIKNNKNELDDLFAINQSESKNNTSELDDSFAINHSEPVIQSVDQAEQRSGSDDMLHDGSEDSLDMLLDAQPPGTVPSSDDIHSLVEPSTNLATSSNMSVTPNNYSKDSQSQERDPLDDFFGNPDQKPEVLSEEEVDNSEHSSNSEEASEHPEKAEENFKPLEDQEEAKPDSDTEELPVAKPKTNLKKSMERSFEDLLHGLSDESEPELDDMIVGDIDNTNLERKAQSRHKSLLESPNKSVFTTPRKPVDLDIATSTPMEKRAHSPQAKVTTPEVKVHTPDDEEEWEGEKNTNAFDEDDVVMRPKKEYQPDSVDDNDLNLEVIENTNHLDVDVSKHKSALGKTGSMALRRKPSRKSRKSLLSTGDDALFQDSTDSKPVDMANGNDEELNGDDDNYDLSPPAKKPSPAIRMPLPGLAGMPPSRRKSASTQDDDEDNAMDTKEVKRSSKPPPGAFVLPSFAPRQPKQQSSPSDTTEKPLTENKPSVFEKPALKSVKPVEKSPSPESDQAPAFSRVGLRSSKRREAEKKLDSEDKDVTFQVPSLRSTPKPNRERTPEEKMDTGMFEKPALKSTPKPKFEQKQTENKESDVFETRNLRSVSKREIDTVKDTISDKHVFDKPSLRSTSRRVDSDSDAHKEESSTILFDKHPLKTTNKDIRSDSSNNNSEHSHTFDKPALRSTNRTNSESNKPESFTHGTFDKPSLKKATPSPEKEVKDINGHKGLFDKPALRRTEVSKEKEKPVTSGKPDWLQQAANKHSKVLEVMHTKEITQGHTEKELPSWLDKSPLKKTRALPLQDTSNSQSTSSSQSDLSNIEDTGKPASTPRSRNTSVSSEKETDRNQPSGPIAKENHNNYTPSWMRQTRSPSVPTTGVLGPAKSLPSLNSSNEVPQWKRELAQRRANRKEKSSEDLPKKDEAVEPDWKKGIALRKTRSTAQPSREVKSVEPEWKKAAEEKHARLRSKSLQYTGFKLK